MVDNITAKSNGYNPTGLRTGGTGSLEIEWGEPRLVELGNIEKAVTALWQQAGKNLDGEGNSGTTRASVLNLIIFVNSETGLTQATEIVARLTWGFPCRAIVLFAQPDSDKQGMQAWVSAHCQLPDAKGKKVCCEQITIEAHGQEVTALSSVVLPLLIADLPIALWWPGNPNFDSDNFKRLLDTSDRLIVDSRDFEKPGQFFQGLSNTLQHHPGLMLSDLNWTRLTPWRNLIAQFYDSPDLMPYVERIERIEIEYEAPYDNDIPNFSQALLLIGWLAEALGWKPAFALKQTGANATIILDRQGFPLNVSLNGHNERLDELGGITRVMLHCSNGDGGEADFSIALDNDFQHATLTTMERGAVLNNRTVVLNQRPDPDLLVEELGMVSHDRAFEAALAIAGKLAHK